MTDKFNVIIVGSGGSGIFGRYGKSRIVELLKSDPKYNIRFVTTDDISQYQQKPLVWFDEMTDLPRFVTKPPKKKPYWRHERW